MNIALVKPSWRYPIAGADHTYNRRWAPLELLNCAAILEARGHEVRLIDGQAEDLPPQDVAARLGRADMTIVTSSALDRWQCPTLELAPLVATIAEIRPIAGKLLLTGFHGTVRPKEMLELTGVDGVIRGEPESTVGELAAGCDWREIAGLTFRRDGQVVSNAEPPPLDMTSLPLPALHLLDLRNYSYEILGSRFLVLEGSRGCPYPCTFCSRVIQGKPLRQKTVEQLGREVETAVQKFGARSIYFIDLEFTALPDLVRGLCEYFLTRKIRVRWCCQTRTDKIDEPLLRLMKRAGCRLIHFGVESGSQRIVEITKKRVSIARQIEGVKLAQRVGLKVLCFFLLGYPGETEEEMRSTIRLARQLCPTYASFHRISPYPGTPLFDQFAAGSTELFPAYAGSEEDRRRVDRLIREAFWSYYVRPGYIVSRLFGTSPASWWRQVRLFAGYFR